MPGGKRNPLSVTHFIEALGDVVNPKAESHAISKVEQTIVELQPETTFADLSIQFIGASGLPKMDVIGTADPYFVAKIDKRISFVSKVIPNTLRPVWNETWGVKNVPTTATLHVTVMDKDEGQVTDDYVGEFTTTVVEGAKETDIVGPLFCRDGGTFWLKIDSTPSVDVTKAQEFPYLFDGPVRYSRHFSPTVGLLTNLDEARLYSTWKMYIKGIPIFFGDKHQHWNHNYRAAQNIFQGPASIAVRSGIQATHRLLYARTAANGFGVIGESKDVVNILHGGAGRPDSANASVQMQYAKRVKPAIYTYIISSDDDSFRFSETGAAFFVDFASKHALHSNCNETVRYSGEFHPRPQGGWQNFSDEIPDDQVEWELVIDNNSGTYSPDKTLLPQLKELLEYNFPSFTIYAWDREDLRLKESVEACREYSMKYRGVGKDELQPPTNEGEVTSMHDATMKAGKEQEGNASDGYPQADRDGGTEHKKTGSNGSAASAGSKSGGASQVPPQSGQDSYDTEPALRAGSGTTLSQQNSQNPPTLLSRPPTDIISRVSSEYITSRAPAGAGHEPLAPPAFPQPTRYVPPTKYIPLENPTYGYALPTNSPSPRQSQIQSHPPSLRPGSRPGSRPVSHDYLMQPPSCMPPTTQRNYGP